jgi:hypothetical protein
MDQPKRQLHVMLTAEAMDLLKRLAALDGITVTALLELLARKEAKRRKIKP